MRALWGWPISLKIEFEFYLIRGFSMLTWLIIDEGLIMYLLPGPEQTAAAAAAAIHYAFGF